MQFKKYEQYIQLLENTNDKLTDELKKELRRFDDADRRYAKKMQNIKITEYRDGETEADMHNYRIHGSEVENKSLICFDVEYLAEALAILSEDQRKVVLHFFYHDLDQHEIAEKEQQHKAMVSYNLKSALCKMLKYLNSTTPS